jgi:tetratricopeptide (TPR) repeat protein
MPFPPRWPLGHRGTALALALISTLPYLPSMRGDFCYDDKVAVGGNPDVCLQNVTLYDIFTHDYWGNDILRRRTTGWTHDSWRPLVTLTFRANHKMSSLDTWSYHVTNVLINAACAYMACFVLLRLSRGSPDPSLRARVGGILFALHPVHSESVANITSRADPLAAIACMAGLLVYLGGSGSQGGRNDDDGVDDVDLDTARTPDSTSNAHPPPPQPPQPPSTCCSCTAQACRAGSRWMLSMLFVLLGLMCKETSLTMPALYPVLDIALALPSAISKAGGSGTPVGAWWRRIFAVLAALPLLRAMLSLVFGATLYYVRIMVMSRGYSLQEFANEMHNPLANIEDAPTRWMAKAYVQSWALAVMAVPLVLSHDHAGSRPVKEVDDPRNLLTLLVFSLVLGVLAWATRTLLFAIFGASHGRTATIERNVDRPRDIHDRASDMDGGGAFAAPQDHSQPQPQALEPDQALRPQPEAHFQPQTAELDSAHALCLAARFLAYLGFVIVTYAPSSHAFLYVAFVVAERTLYLPSLGVVALMAEAFALVSERGTDGSRDDKMVQKRVVAGQPSSHVSRPQQEGPRRRAPPILLLALLFLLSLHYAAFSAQRNFAWASEDALLTANIALYPENNGMSYYGMGAVRMHQGRFDEAESYLERAINETTLAEPHILLGQIQWKHRRNFTRAIEVLQNVEFTSSPRKEVLQHLGLLLMLDGRAPDTDDAARRRAEYLVLAGYQAHGYPMGHPNIGALASNAACVRLLSEPHRFRDFRLMETLMDDALTYKFARRPTTIRNAAFAYAVIGKPDRALEVLEDGLGWIAHLRSQPNLPPEAQAEADGYVRSFELARLAIHTHMPLIARWQEEGQPPSRAATERRLALIGGECSMDLHFW